MRAHAAVMVAEDAPLEYMEIDFRSPAETDVVVRVEATPFCVTDWLGVHGSLGIAARGILPTVLGHAAVGEVIEVGANVTRVRAGDRVLVPATPECGRCRWCARGRMDQCVELFAPPAVIGSTTDGVSVTAYGNVGSYADVVVVREIGVFAVRSGLPAEWLSMIGCGICSGVGAVLNVAQVRPGSSVAIIGCGQVGLWMVQGARLAGADRIIAADPDESRRSSALQLGATNIIDSGAVNVVGCIKDLTAGIGVDYGFDAGGTSGAVVDAFRATSLAGVVVLTSLESTSATVTLPLFDLALRGRDVRSAQSGRTSFTRDIPLYTRWLETGQLDAAAMLGSRYRLGDVNGALDAAGRRTELTPMIVN